jgi:hypothetical protein
MDGVIFLIAKKARHKDGLFKYLNQLKISFWFYQQSG